MKGKVGSSSEPTVHFQGAFALRFRQGSFQGEYESEEFYMYFGSTPSQQSPPGLLHWIHKESNPYLPLLLGGGVGQNYP